MKTDWFEFDKQLNKEEDKDKREKYLHKSFVILPRRLMTTWRLLASQSTISPHLTPYDAPIGKNWN